MPDLAAAIQIDSYLQLKSSGLDQILELNETVWAIAKSRVSTAAEAAEQFEVMKRIVKAVRSSHRKTRFLHTPNCVGV